MPSSTLGGTLDDVARSHVLPPCREGRVSKVLPDRLEVAVRSLTGDMQTLAARGWHPVIEDTDDGPAMILPKRGDRAWVGDDEGRALVVVAWQRIGDSPAVTLNTEAPTDAATLAAVGDVKWTARTTAPSGWLACDGTAVTVASGHIALRNALLADGSPYGVSGSDPRVPEMRGRVPVGAGAGPGLTARTAGQSGGAEGHVLTTPEMPAHKHAVTVRTNAAAFGVADVAISNNTGSVVSTSGVMADTGGGAAHPNMQPWAALLAVIKT